MSTVTLPASGTTARPGWLWNFFNAPAQPFDAGLNTSVKNFFTKPATHWSTQVGQAASNAAGSALSGGAAAALPLILAVGLILALVAVAIGVVRKVV